MAIGDDFTVNLAGDIRHASGTTKYTVLELHRWLQDLADDPEASGNDLIDITSTTPSARSTDNIIDLLSTYNIDDDAAEYFYDGSITQANGGTVYSGLRVLGAVNNTDTQLMVIQDDDLYQFTPNPEIPFWGDQSTGGYNGVAAAGILMRCLIKSRDNGADIDGQRIRVQARHWGDTFDFFNVQLGTGESVAALGTTPDAQNDTAQGTVNAYTHVTNTEGYQTIDLQNGNGALPYYSQWTYGADTSGDGLKGMWEYIKDVSANGTVPVDAQTQLNYDNTPTSEGTFVGGSSHANSDVITLDDGSTVTVVAHTTGTVTEFTVDNSTSNGSVFVGETLSQVSTTGSGTGFSLTVDTDNVTASKTVHGGYPGSQLLGITHSYSYDAGAAFTEDETVVWGTKLFYDTLVSGPFTPGNYVTIGSNGAAGRVMYDDGVDELIVALEDTSITLLDTDVITEYSGPGAAATTTTAAVDTGGGAIVDNDKAGGSGLLLAATGVATGDHYIQLLTGSPPVDNLPIRGITSASTALVAGTVTARTVPKIFLGSYTGSLIGAYGIGVLDTNLTSSDTLQSLDGTSQQPPNNVTFTLSGLVIGEDYALIGPKAGGNDFDFAQLTLTTTLNTGSETSLVVDEAIPADTPSAGTLRVTLDDGRIRKIAYSAWVTSTFTITDESWLDPDDATSGNAVMISYIDKLAASTDETFTGVYKGSATSLWIRVRDGGSTPIKTFESPGTLGSAGGSAVAGRITDE